MPAEEQVNHEQYLDSTSKLQYPDFFPAKLRRFYTEQSESGYTVLEKTQSYLYEAGLVSPRETGLDIGCGDNADNLILAWLFGHTGRLVGLEPPLHQGSGRRWEDKFAHTQRHLDDLDIDNVEHVMGYVQEMVMLNDNEFDFAFINWVLQHVKGDIGRALSEIKRVVRPGGIITFITNAEGSAPIKHEVIRRTAEKVGSKSPGQLSAPFNGNIALAEASIQFQIVKVLHHVDRVPLYSDNLGLLSDVVDTYELSIVPALPDSPRSSRWAAAKEQVLGLVESRINSNGGVIYDPIHQVSIICRNN